MIHTDALGETIEGDGFLGYRGAVIGGAWWHDGA